MKFVFLVLVFFSLYCQKLTSPIANEPYQKQTWDFQWKGSLDPRLGYIIVLHPVVSDNLFFTEEHYFQFWKDLLSDLKKEGYLLPERTLLFLGNDFNNELYLSGFQINQGNRESLDQGLFKNTKRKLLFCPKFSCSIEEAVLRQNSRNMAHQFQSVFSQLSSSFRINWIPGAFTLPSSEIREKRIFVSESELVPFSSFFNADGEIMDFSKQNCMPVKWGSICQEKGGGYKLSIVMSDESSNEIFVNAGFKKEIMGNRSDRKTEIITADKKSFVLAPDQAKSIAVIFPIENLKKEKNQVKKRKP